MKHVIGLVIVVFCGACGGTSFRGAAESTNEGFFAEESQDLVAELESLPDVMDQIVVEAEEETFVVGGKDQIAFCSNHPSPINGNCQQPGFQVARSLNIANTDLRNIDLRQGDIVDSSFSQVNLTGSCGSNANLSRSTMAGVTLSAANYMSSNFSYVTLGQSDLQKSIFARSNFSFAEFRQTDFRDTCIEGSNFSFAVFHESTEAQNLAAAYSNFSKVRFRSQSNFSGSDFSNSNLAEVSFGKGTNFSGVNFRRANLQGASIGSNVNFTEANFSGATWIDGRTCAEGSIGQCL